MKQTHMSMHHIVQAIETYKAHETYSIRVIQCSFVIGLNYLDMEYPEKAIPHFMNALKRFNAFIKCGIAFSGYSMSK